MDTPQDGGLAQLTEHGCRVVPQELAGGDPEQVRAALDAAVERRRLQPA